jgi:RNA polymerase sigma factor (sigma-70 family)
MTGEIISLDGKAKTSGEDRYREMINRHLPLIERQCFSAVRRQLKNYGDSKNAVNIENEALELSNQVLDTLRRDNYRVLRQFKGDSLLSTYITTIVARQAVDMLRKKLGRSREKERAQKMGDFGLQVYEKIMVQGCTVKEVLQEQHAAGNTELTTADVEDAAAKIKGKRSILPEPDDNNPAVKKGTQTPGSENSEAELVIPDTRCDPQEQMLEEQRKQQISQAVTDVVENLNGEERFILSMRFPADETEKPMKICRIAGQLGISEKAVYKRVSRILKKCRTILEKKGVGIDELFY